MNKIKKLALKAVYSNPWVFDVLKRASREVGVRSRLFDELRRIRIENPNANVLQIGANDGVVNDPIREHILASNWQCVLVEPVPYLFARLEKNYRWIERVKCLNAAVSDTADEMEFYYIKEEALPSLPHWASQIGSFSSEHIRKHLGEIEPNWIASRKLKIMSMHDLLQNAGVKDFDLIHLDVEGFESRLIKAFLEIGLMPRAVLYESHHLGEERPVVESMLRNHGYRLEAHGMDTLALR